MNNVDDIESEVLNLAYNFSAMTGQNPTKLYLGQSEYLTLMSPKYFAGLKIFVVTEESHINVC